MHLGAVVLLPRGYDDNPRLRYPVVFEADHFGLEPAFGFTTAPPSGGPQLFAQMMRAAGGMRSLRRRHPPGDGSVSRSAFPDDRRAVRAGAHGQLHRRLDLAGLACKRRRGWMQPLGRIHPLRGSAPPVYFASGSGRSWKRTTLLGVPLPVSAWNGARVLQVAHTPRPFQPASGSSMRPSIHLV